MNDFLFDIAETKSPRLKWMEENSIRAYHNPDRTEPWQAITSWHGAEISERGQTEDDAIVALAKRINLKLWNESNEQSMRPERKEKAMNKEPGSLCPSDATTCSVVAPNLVQAGNLWLMEDEDAYHPDKMEYSLLIQCANAEQVREAMKTGKIEFTIFAHYPQNV